MPSAVVLSHNWIAHELGHLEPWLERNGYTVTRVYREDQPALPAADLLVVMGSPHSVAGPAPSSTSLAEVDAVTHWLSNGRPYLGICFGAQVLATAMGGTVTKLSEPFSGYAPLALGAQAPPSLGGPWVVWHNDGIRAPVDATLLGSLGHADLAFRTERAWGLQPHIEVNADVLERMLKALGTEERDYTAIAEALRNDDTNVSRVAELLDEFLADVS